MQLTRVQVQQNNSKQLNAEDSDGSEAEGGEGGAGWPRAHIYAVDDGDRCGATMS